jgi:branched-chain amino acid transport system ATP-binding protein
MEPILEVTNLATGYGDLRAVWDVSFRLEQGSVFALLGRNGAGKTTTLRAISGLNPVQAGDVAFEGASIKSLPPYERIRRGIGFVQEGKRIFRDQSVEDNLRMGLFTFKGSRAEVAARYEWAYETFPALATRKKRQAGLLSGGQQQMLAIAQAIMPGPRVLLVDEPSAGLAPAIVGDVVDILAKLRDEGLAIVLVEQSVDFALAIAADVAVLDIGRVTYAGSTSTPGAPDAIRSAYMGELLSIAEAESEGAALDA